MRAKVLDCAKRPQRKLEYNFVHFDCGLSVVPLRCCTRPGIRYKSTGTPLLDCRSRCRESTQQRADEVQSKYPGIPVSTSSVTEVEPLMREGTWTTCLVLVAPLRVLPAKRPLAGVVNHGPHIV